MLHAFSLLLAPVLTELWDITPHELFVLPSKTEYKKSLTNASELQDPWSR